jgi:hypothetical protein
MRATGGLERQKKVCLVFAVGPESDGNRGSSCYGARNLRARGPPVRVSRGAHGSPRGPRKGPRQEEAQERAWEGKVRLGLCLRKKKERRKKKQMII